MAEKKAKTGKTVTVRQIRSANRKPDIQAQTLRGLGLAFPIILAMSRRPGCSKLLTAQNLTLRPNRFTQPH